MKTVCLRVCKRRTLARSSGVKDVSPDVEVLLPGEGLHVTAPGGARLDASPHLVGAASLGLRHEEQDQSARRDP